LDLPPVAIILIKQLRSGQIVPGRRLRAMTKAGKQNRHRASIGLAGHYSGTRKVGDG